MEIDIEKEQEKIQKEIQQLSDSLVVLRQQEQQVTNQLIMKQGQMELLERINKEEPSADITKVNEVA